MAILVILFLSHIYSYEKTDRKLDAKTNGLEDCVRRRR